MPLPIKNIREKAITKPETKVAKSILDRAHREIAEFKNDEYEKKESDQHIAGSERICDRYGRRAVEILLRGEAS